MKIVADQAIPWLHEAFGSLGEVVAMEGARIDADAVRDAEVLLTRSITKVNADLVRDSKLQLVASATAGYDHVDTAALRDAGIAFAYAPGCNAQGVVEYVLTELMAAAAQGGPGWLSRGPIGVVGFGHVGRRLTVLLRELGLDVLVHDPPLQHAVDKGELPDLDEDDLNLVERETYIDLDQLLETASVVTLHVARVTQGPWPTTHLLDASRLSQMRSDALLVNTSRGDVVDGAALRAWLDESSGGAILDVWENEPNLNPDLLRHTSVLRATPHIAGYTTGGKARGTAMAHAAVCRHWGRDVSFTVGDVLAAAKQAPTPAVRTSDVHWLGALLRGHHDLSAVDAQTRALVDLDADAAAGAFEALRSAYPLRSELAARLRPDVPDVEQRVLPARLDGALRRLCPQSA